MYPNGSKGLAVHQIRGKRTHDDQTKIDRRSSFQSHNSKSVGIEVVEKGRERKLRHTVAIEFHHRSIIPTHHGILRSEATSSKVHETSQNVVSDSSTSSSQTA